MGTDSGAPFTCVVCGGAAGLASSAECNWCDSRYHLNQRNDVEAPDCGQVWIDDQHLALQFACNNCLAGAESELANPAQKDETHARASSAQPRRKRRYRRRA